MRLRFAAARPLGRRGLEGGRSVSETKCIQNSGYDKCRARRRVVPASARSQRSESTELRGSFVDTRERPSPRHIASRGTEVFVQRAGEGGDTRGSAGSVCLAWACSVSQVGLRMTLSQVHQKKKTRKLHRNSTRMPIRVPVPFSLCEGCFETSPCAASLLLTALFLINFCSFAIFFTIPLTSICLRACSAAVRALVSHLACLPALPSPLSFLGIHQFSCSFPGGAMGQGYTHAHTHTQRHRDFLDSTIQAWTSRPICDSASCRWELWQFGEVVKCHADT